MRKQLSFKCITKGIHFSDEIPISLFMIPINQSQYKKMLSYLDKLIDIVGEDEKHPLADLMSIIGDNIERYDDRTLPKIGEQLTEIEKVKYLMAEYGYTQKDLAYIFGGQGNVSKFLNGERRLNRKQIEGLKEKFNISADFFI